MKVWLSYWKEYLIHLGVMVIAYFIGWLFGVFLAFTPLGLFLIEGLNLIFDTDTFERANFANVMGTFLFFASFFHRRED